MMYTTTDLSGKSKEINSLNNLLDKINNKLLIIGSLAYETAAYGIQHDCNSAEDLLMYREILIWKMNGCGCFNKICLDKIISKINKLTI